MDAGTVFVGIQLGGLQAFVSGWAAAGAALASACKEMGAALAIQVERIVDLGGQIANLNDVTKLSTEFLSELRYTCQLSGASFEGVAKAIGKAQEQGKLLNGEGGFIRALERLGDIQDPVRRATEAFRQFGQGSTDILPLVGRDLRAIAEDARRLGVVWSGQQTDAIDQLGNLISRAKESVTGLWKEITVQLTPSLTKLFAFIGNLVPALTGWLAGNQMVGKSMDWLAQVAATTWDAFWQFEIKMSNAFKRIGNAALDLYLDVSKVMTRLVSYVSAAAGLVVQAAFTAIRAEVDNQLTVFSTLGSGAVGLLGKLFGVDGSSIDALRTGLGIAAGVGQQAIQNIVSGARAVVLNGGTVAEIMLGQLDKLTGADHALASVQGFADSARHALNTVTESAIHLGKAMYNVTAEVPKAVQKTAEAATQTANRYSTLAEGYMTKLKDVIHNRLDTMGKSFAATFASMTKAGKGFAEAIGASLMEAVGSQAVTEGTYHFMAGLAMLFAPGMHGQGAARMARGMALMAFGSMLSGSAGGGASAGGGGGGGSEPASSGPATPIDYGDTTGATVEQQKRPYLLVQVQGHVLDGRGLWSHISELSHEFSDHDMKLALGSLEA